MKRRRRYAAAAAVPRATWEFYDFDEDCDGAGRPEFFDLVPHFEDACRLGQLQKPYYWPFITDFGAIALLWEDKTRMIFCVEPTYELTKEGMSKITRKYASIQNAKPSKYRLKVDALMDAPKWPLVYTSKATRPRMTQYGADSPRNAQPVQPVTLELPDPSAIEKATTAVRLVRKRKTDQAGASPVVSGTLPPDSDLSPLSTEGDSEPQNLRSYKIERIDQAPWASSTDMTLHAEFRIPQTQLPVSPADTDWTVDLPPLPVDQLLSPSSFALDRSSACGSEIDTSEN